MNEQTTVQTAAKPAAKEPRAGTKIARALQLIAAAGGEGISMKGIVAELVKEGHPSDTCYNPLNARVAAGLLERLPNGNYRLPGAKAEEPKPEEPKAEKKKPARKGGGRKKKPAEEPKPEEPAKTETAEPTEAKPEEAAAAPAEEAKPEEPKAEEQAAA